MKRIIISLTCLIVLMFGIFSVKAQNNIIKVVSPAYCSDIKGNTKIDILAPGFTKLIVKCWKQGSNFGVDSSIGEISLKNDGKGSIVFPADKYPHGPVTIRISGTSSTDSDNCYLQLYNKGGVSWNQGMPADPPAAKGMKLVFADDFDKTLSIGDNPNTTYYDHKPPHGSQDFSSIPFVSFDKPNNPFNQVDTYLRIRVSEKDKSAGLISSLKNDKTGITAKAPCYFECRFIGPNAPGSWPAFWLLSVDQSDSGVGDELDIIEAYGGEGIGKPNSGPIYRVTSHAWNQPGAPTDTCDNFYKTRGAINMKRFGIPSTWYEAPHVYGCKITEAATIYYCDNIEVARHETLPISKVEPFYFMINLATGGGWPVDLSRYNGIIDMYVDYVRVYSGTSAKL